MKKIIETTEQKTTFADLLRNYENAVLNSTDFHKNAFELSTAIVFSVLKKLDIVSSNPTTKALKIGLAKDLHHLSAIHNCTNNAKSLEYNENGELISVVTDKSLHNAFGQIISESLSDGLELVSVAYLELLEQTQKATTENRLKPNFLETPFTIRRLKKKVYIQDVNSLGGYETTETTAIQECYKVVRREIESNKTVTSASEKFLYLDELLTDSESGTTETIYRRLPKYYNIATPTTDINGKITSITADETTTAELDELIASLNLTDKQATILKYRLCGYGYKAIATYLGISVSTIRTQLQALQKKATESGLSKH